MLEHDKTRWPTWPQDRPSFKLAAHYVVGSDPMAHSIGVCSIIILQFFPVRNQFAILQFTVQSRLYLNLFI